MLRQMLVTQWKWSKLELGVFAVVCFALPTFMMKIVRFASGSGGPAVSIEALLQASSAMGVALAFVALLCGVTIAVRPWIVDHARQHVLALSLPLPWPDFVRLRFLAGAIFLAVPAVAVWLGAILAAYSTPIPSTLHVYPASVAVRFYAAALIMYAGGFAVQYLVGRKSATWVAGTFALVVVIELVAQSFGSSVMVRSWELITQWPGPIEVLTARWMLVDV